MCEGDSRSPLTTNRDCQRLFGSSSDWDRVLQSSITSIRSMELQANVADNAPRVLELMILEFTWSRQGNPAC